MSEFNVEVFQIERIEPHDNAHSLEIVYYKDYPVVWLKGIFAIGDKAVYVPVDAIVRVDLPEFASLKLQETQLTARIRPRKLRGVYSQGFLCTALPQWQIGQNVQKELCIERYDPGTSFEKSGLHASDNVRCPVAVPVYDLDAVRQFPNVFANGELVYVTEKIHGTNARFFHDAATSTFYVGSHRQWMKDSPDNVWWKIARKYNMESICASYPNVVFYGEIFGKGIQRGFDYNTVEPELRIFDLYNLRTGTFAPCWVMLSACNVVGLPTIEPLYYDFFSPDVLLLRNGMSRLKPSQLREGIVIESVECKTFVDAKGYIHRKKLKFVGEDYLLRGK